MLKKGASINAQNKHGETALLQGEGVNSVQKVVGSQQIESKLTNKF